MKRPLRHLLTLTLIAPLALGACADAGDDELEMPADTAATGMEEMPAAPAAEPMTSDVEAVGDAEISGEVTVLHQRDSATVTLDLEGLEEGMNYQAALMSGPCPENGEGLMDAGDTGAETGADTGEQPGQSGQQQRIADLTLTVTGGTGTASAVLPATQLRQGQEAHVAVMTDDGRTVACGDLEDDGLNTPTPPSM